MPVGRGVSLLGPSQKGIVNRKGISASDVAAWDHWSSFKLSVLLKLKGECRGGSVWPNVARAWTENTGSQRTGILESGPVATFFAYGAGDGNRTRTISLGMETVPG